MTRPPASHGEWMEVYRRRAALDPLRAVLDEGDPDNRKNAYVDAVEKFHLSRALRGIRPRLALDLGCGVGRFTDLLRARAGTVIGIDASEDLLRVAAGRVATGAGLFARGVLTAIPVRAGAVELAVCCQVLLHLVTDEALAAAAREFRRVVAPGGKAILLEHLSPGVLSLRREGVIHRSPCEFLAPFLAAGFTVEKDRPIRKTPSRLVHWVRRGRVPRLLWTAAARLEPFFARAGREPPTYRDHLVTLRG